MSTGIVEGRMKRPRHCECRGKLCNGTHYGERAREPMAGSHSVNINVGQPVP
jgi:hypothetical protein